MFANIAQAIFGTSNERVLKRFSKDIEIINGLEPEYESLSDNQIKAKTDEFRQRLKEGETLDDIMHEAFATVREAAKRTLGQRHYDVQLIGGIVLHRGMISEMKTGEGKTLVSTLAAYLNAVERKGVHVVTVNDYLAARDSEWMGKVFAFLGLSTGCIMAGMNEQDRRDAYACDITYGTNNEFGFDYLRDNMKFSLDQMVQRPFNFAIIDEVDSILIDEARTPLIISGPAEDSSELYTAIDKIIPQLDEDDYEVDEKMKTVALNEKGQERAEELLKSHGLLEDDSSMYDAQNINLVHHVNQALRAHKLFSKDTDYIVKDNKVIIIDEFTGRMMEGRRFSEGLHQALEAKENAKIENENQTLASITFQNYFRLYPKLSGMTGTAMTEAAEFADIYALQVVEIPTNIPVSRIDHNDEIYKNYEDKFQAILAQINDCQSRGQPILVGTTSIEKSEQLSAALTKMKIKHQVLNARYHEQEAQIISQAGRSGAVTIATNMAGRGTDIQLGGNADMRASFEIDESLPETEKEKKRKTIEAEVQEDRAKVRAAGGLYVIGTERHESRRIDNQLRGRSGRQGDPGDSKFFLSLEDDLMRIFGAERLQPLLAHKQIGLQEGESLAHPLISKTLERAQCKVEAQNFEIRKNLLKFDNVMNDQRKIIYEQRREIMEGIGISEMVADMRHDLVHDLIENHIPKNAYPEQWDMEGLKTEALRVFSLELPFDEWAKEEGIAEDEMLSRLQDAVESKFKEKENAYGAQVWEQAEKAILLQQLDQHWKEHLLNLDHLRQGISLRAFGQRDPLNEYKTEAFQMFSMLLDMVRENTVRLLSLVEIASDQDIAEELGQRRALGNLHEGRTDPAARNAAQQAAAQQQAPNVVSTPFRNPTAEEIDADDPSTWGKVARNALCPCGSGKKYKHCHGQL